MNKSGIEDSSFNFSDIFSVTSCQPKPFEKPLDLIIAKCIALVIGLLVIVIALIGNSLVCHVVLPYKQRMKVINVLIMNIAVCDIMIAIFHLAYLLNIIFLNYWPFGYIPCCVYTYIYNSILEVSTFTMVAISIDRYIAVMWPFKSRSNGRKAKYIVFIIWMLAALTSAPFLFSNALQQPSIWYQKCGLYICFPKMEGNIDGFYNEILRASHIYVPFIVLLFTYISIGVVLWRKRTPGEAQKSRDQKMVKSKIKMVKTMLVVVIAFMICWMPFGFYYKFAKVELWVSMCTWNEYAPVTFLLYLFGMSHTCHNPIIYFWLNDEFRRGFYAVFRKTPILRRSKIVQRSAGLVPLKVKISDASSTRSQPSVSTINANFSQSYS
ncbi:RYamide receptor-like [Daktulosphaira vitifoliae]|uniref:RYamide receptor-like n=1 Tax=Daktulosphaira vitifoliae TaxID=58002 RepID=UPI0021AA68D9|nr:RYamide receptor-like [Daktulosphaira vitifoliae]XP_050533864.1 RYamide receptor-like [Daktulosphaira vitifoliae]XP_050533865.1 RYamide receptor-like [Daktulosphaira vitifoliae]XP_050533866.1 RYamide receptor-like [Daktulosphaira vitifoliae]XP_050533867.1 RYamide receptor-like [Daktulosphaira vitifoliae]XP_050533868.1 RYamide receptor-like [Daktulosphaira vitifoliae]XP_050533869.1 RYamide receptor-like [Daktulosphaira vitifoliae]